jgi:hypothetical protein
MFHTNGMTLKIANNRSKKIIIRLLMGCLIFLFLLIISGFLLIYYNQNRIKSIFIEELNKSLTTEISVKEIEFSVFEKFPNASLCFKNVVAKDALKIAGNKDTLLTANSIFLEFNIWDLYYKKYNIKNIVLENAKVFLKINKDGTDNFHFWKVSDNSSNSDFSFSLKKIILKNVALVYIDKTAQQYYDFFIEKASAKGDFSNEIQEVELKGKLKVNHLQSGELVYLRNDFATINAKAIINSGKENIEFKQADLLINDLNFSVIGNISYKTDNKSLNLKINGNNIQLHDFIKELPTEQQTYFENYKSSGIFDIKLNINGLYGNSKIPAISVIFNFQQGEILQKQTNVKLTNVLFNGSYTNNSSIDIQKHVLEINNFSCKMDHGIISGNFILNDFKNPFISCKITANLNLEEIHKFLKNKKIEQLNGNLAFTLDFRGKINKDAINIKDFINSKTTGNAVLKNINVVLENDSRKYKIADAALEFTNNDILINTLTGNISGSDFKLKGSFTNVIPFIFLENQKIQVNADLYSEMINLDELIGTKSTDKTYTELKLSDTYDFNLNIHLNRLNFKKFKANTLNGNIRYINHIIKAENISMNAMNGNLNGNLSIDGSQQGKYKISCDVKTINVNAAQLFDTFDNFGQKNLTSQHINGNIAANIQFAALFDSRLQIDKKTVWAILDLKIDNGILTNYQPIMKLSKFVNEDELKEIKFKTLENQLLIKNEIISIPSMEIKSTALNMTISGEHKFNNEINYRINLLLSELISRKRKAGKLKHKQSQQEFGYEEDDGLGRTKLFLKVSGTIDNPIFKYDTKSLKDKLMNDFKTEKKNLQKVLNDEFKWLKKDSTDKIQEQRFKIQEKGNYIIDWEENTTKPVKTETKDSLPPSGVKIKWEEDEISN